MGGLCAVATVLPSLGELPGGCLDIQDGGLCTIRQGDDIAQSQGGASVIFREIAECSLGVSF